MKPSKSIPAQRPTAAARAAPRAGQLIGGRYRLEEWLESGSMGNVWRAEQVRLRSPAAIKFLDPCLIEFPEMHERFLQEARSAAAVQSAHVVQIFDYGSEAGLPYIAMELLRGENLDTRLAQRRLLTPGELNRIFSEVARGLGQAHALGVIHRDVKPGNIFLAREGEHEVTKLIDFGIAKVKEHALRVSQITGTEQGTVLGTPQYMSPEQVRGRNTVDYRTDLWALGIIACECLTGRNPFSGTTIGDLAVQICTEDPLAPSLLGEVPAGFDEWFFKSTSKEPLDRFESAGEMAEALTKILLASPEHEPATLRSRASIELPSWRQLREAGRAASGHVLRSLASAFDRGLALTQTLAEALRRKALLVADFVRLLGARRSWLRTSASRWAWIGLVTVACGLVLWRPERATPRRSVEPTRLVQTVLAASPPAPLPVIQPPPRALAADRVVPYVPPILKPQDLPPSIEEADVPSKPAKAASTPPHRRKKQNPPASSAGSSPTPLSPMSVAMGELGARIAQGGEPRRRAPVPAPGSVRARKRASTKAE